MYAKNPEKGNVLAITNAAAMPAIGCVRVTIDMPRELFDRVQQLSRQPPEDISVSEWIRRVVAHHAAYEMPPLRQRIRTKTRLDGKPKASSRTVRSAPAPLITPVAIPTAAGANGA